MINKIDLPFWRTIERLTVTPIPMNYFVFKFWINDF